MSGKKNSVALPVMVVLGLAVIGTVGYFMTSKSADEPQPAEEVVAEQSTPNEVETAAGNAEQSVEEVASSPETSTDGDASNFTVEPGNPIVAKVDGKDITRVDVYRFIQTMPANLQQLPASTVYPMALEQVINVRLVQNRADASDVMESKEFAQELELSKQQIARNLFLQESVKDKVSDGDIKKAYKEYVSKIPDVEERRASHILLETQEKAQAVIDKLKTGETFEDLAKSVSIGPTGPKGGDLGYFGKDDMVPEFGKAAFSMKKGDVSKEPVQTQFGWHVIKVTDARQRPKPTLEQLKPTLQAELGREALDQQIQSWRDKASIERFDINGKPLKEGANAIGVVPQDTHQHGG